MFCNHCGAEAPEESLFCNRCGCNLTGLEKRLVPRAVTIIPEKPNRFRWKKESLIIAALLIGMAILAIALVTESKNRQDVAAESSTRFSAKISEPEPEPESEPTPEPTPVPTPTPAPTPAISSLTLVNGTFTINGGAYTWYVVAIPFGAQNPVLTGRFTASGGSRNDIEVYLVDEDGFTNIKNGNGAPTYYNSGSATVGQINVRLPDQRVFYLIVDNRGGLFRGPRAYTLTATITYLKPPQY
jgi:hypothetical protein